jgi:hypothetical protein
MQPPVYADGDTDVRYRRVYLTDNQRAEQVGDRDRRFCEQRDSISAKVGRFVLWHGSIAAARLAAPLVLGKLVLTFQPGHTKLPSLVAGQSDAERGLWAAKLICVKPLPRDRSVPYVSPVRAKGKKVDSRRPGVVLYTQSCTILYRVLELASHEP